MDRSKLSLALSKALIVGLPLIYASSIYAAKPIDLNHQTVSVLQPFLADQGTVKIEETSRSVDFNKTLHVRVQQTYSGYPVWGADAIVHVPQGAKVDKPLSNVLVAAGTNKGSMDGTIYQNLNADLANTPQLVFSQVQAQKAVEHAVDAYQHKVGGKINAQAEEKQLIVFVDKNNKAHWAYKVSFFVEPKTTSITPAKPVYIIDAVTFQVYQQWDDIKTIETVDAFGGGFGGNKKMGKLIYDGLTDHLAKLNMKRDDVAKNCTLENADVTVKNYKGSKVMSFGCNASDPDHNNVFWDADYDAVNDGYSPSNDALFGGAVIKDMYQKWYGIPVLTTKDGKPMMLNMVVHVPQYDNAYWDGSKMTFGDGYTMFYPLTSLGVAAHEISHGFTQQHSNLTYSGQSGGMNEAFSDMAAQGAEFYAYGHNSWQIGPEIFKAENEALRYMDQPSKDCKGRTPGDWCSIDDASEYTDYLDVHFSSGVYNHFFYLLGTSEGWDAKKAFDVMVHANSNYWTSSATFVTGACGVLKATKDLGFDVEAVQKAFKAVAVDTANC